MYLLLLLTMRAQGGPGGAPPHIPPGANIGQSLGNYKKNYRQVCPALSFPALSLPRLSAVLRMVVSGFAWSPGYLLLASGLDLAGVYQAIKEFTSSAMSLGWKSMC